MQTETVRSLFVFVGGMLTFLGAVLTFINNRLQQAQTTGEKAKIYGHSISFILFALCLGTGAVCSLLKSAWPIAALSFLFFTVNCYWFVTNKAKISRREIAILVGLASCFVTSLLLALIFETAQILESVVVIVGKLAK